MDEVVRKAIAKWPNVPAAYGWLELGRRGEWSIKGERITNPAVIAFIGRTYAADATGRWFFQNGPQRVFVTLAYTPLVLRTLEDDCGIALVAHTGQGVDTPHRAWIDERGNLLLACDAGIGLLDDRDLPAAVAGLRDEHGNAAGDTLVESYLSGAPARGMHLAFGASILPVEPIRSTAVAQRFGFDPDPRPQPGEPEC